nr:prolyl 4-hydroxylase 1 [Ipomoea trifida]
MATAMRIVLGLLTFVTLGMIIGALVQLAYIWKLEDTYGTEPTLRGLRGIQHGVNPLAKGISHLAYDKEAVILRLGYVCQKHSPWIIYLQCTTDLLA